MEVLAFSVFTYISITGTKTESSLKNDRSANHYSKLDRKVRTSCFSVASDFSEIMPSTLKQKTEFKKVFFKHVNITWMYLFLSYGAITSRKKSLTWLRWAGPGAGWGRAAGKPSQTLWSCSAPSCPSDLWHQHRWLSPAPQWPWDLEARAETV